MVWIQCHVLPLRHSYESQSTRVSAFSRRLVTAIYKYLTFFDYHLSVS